MRVIIAAAVISLAALLAACSDGLAAGTCRDQTSYDDNWDNDMMCKRQDGSTFETDYAGAAAFESKHSQ